MRRILDGADDDAVLPIRRALAGEHEKLSVGRGHHVIHSPRVRDDRIGDDGFGWIADVQRVHHVAAAAGSEVRVFAIGVQPHFFRREAHAGQPADDGRRATYVAVGHVDRGLRRPGAE